MNQLEQNITNSFKKAKNDIIRLQNAITVLHQNQESLMAWIQDTKGAKQFIASEKGRKIHVENCPYGKRIKTKVLFNAKEDALDAGFQACACMA